MAGIKIVDAKVSFQYPLEGYAKEKRGTRELGSETIWGRWLPADDW
jgi:hypothetical protein